MTDDHDWHLFDEEHLYQVRRIDGQWKVRRVDNPLRLIVLTDEEFDQWRSEGVNPKGLK